MARRRTPIQATFQILLGLAFLSVGFGLFAFSIAAEAVAAGVGVGLLVWGVSGVRLLFGEVGPESDSPGPSDTVDPGCEAAPETPGVFQVIGSAAMIALAILFVLSVVWSEL